MVSVVYIVLRMVPERARQPPLLLFRKIPGVLRRCVTRSASFDFLRNGLYGDVRQRTLEKYHIEIPTVLSLFHSGPPRGRAGYVYPMEVSALLAF